MKIQSLSHLVRNQIIGAPGETESPDYLVRDQVLLHGEGSDYLGKDEVVESPATTWLQRSQAAT